MIKRALYNWPQKLGALVLATLMWFLVSITDTSTTQRNFTIPVNYEGAGSDKVISGAPPSVSIDVSGATNLVNRLKPENFSASLDFTNVTGSYEQKINVVLPQGTVLQRVSPATAIGTVEAITSKAIPVEVSFGGTLPSDLRFTATPSPDSVTALGRSSSLSRVEKAIAISSSTETDVAVKLFAADKDNQPVLDVSLEPNTVRIVMEAVPVLLKKTVPLTIQEPDVSPATLTNFTPSQDSLDIAGSSEALATIERVTASVDLDTPLDQSGTYTFKVVPDLPEGVTALEVVTVNLDINLPPDTQVPANGDTNGTTSSPLRGPNPP